MTVTTSLYFLEVFILVLTLEGTIQRLASRGSWYD